jgi:anaerobic C4-dicarboxylate transporter DcuB
MADTFIANNEDAIVSALGDLANRWPFMIAVSIFLVAALTTSQSAATSTMVPLGLAHRHRRRLPLTRTARGTFGL